MTSKTIAARADSTCLSAQKHPKKARLQAGISLVEMMVGLAIGLLVVAAATTGLMVSRGISGTVSDASSLQQQAAYGFRVIGLQLRQAGSLYLNPDPSNSSSIKDPQNPAAFETDASSVGGGNSFTRDSDTISSDSATNTLTVGYRRYKEPLFIDNSGPQSLARNCLGGPENSSKDQRIENIFRLSGNELQCSGNGAAAQAILSNVAEVQVRYYQQGENNGDTLIKKVANFNASDWNTIQGVEVCLVLYGNEVVNMPDGSSYTDCSGNPVDMTSLSGARAKRLHMLFRNVYQLRSQGRLSLPAGI